MNGLLGARVAVIDDNEEEAMLLIKALGRKGVSAIYCTGQWGEFPPAPLKTLRLVFLDLYLVETGDLGAIMRTTVDALSKVADLSRNGLGIILWTKHPKDDQDLFATALAEQFKSFRPLFVVPQEKNYYLEHFDELDKLISDIERRLAEAPGLRLMLDWEQFVHVAVSASGDLLAQVAGSDTGIMDLAAALVVAAGGVGDSESETAARFFEAVNPILLDSIGIANQTEIAKADHFGALHKLSASPPKLSPEHCAMINRVLLTAVVQVGQTCVAQGNLYLKDDWEGTGTPFPMIVDEEGIKNELYTLFAFRAHRDDPEKKKKTEEWKTRMSALAKTAIPCAVEVSPGCDHAQKKMVYARVLGGLLIPDDGLGQLSIPAEVRTYAKQLPLFQIKDEKRKIDRRYTLVLNARHLVTPTPDALKKLQPLLRIREAVAVDIQAWFSGHAGRAGFVSLW